MTSIRGETDWQIGDRFRHFDTRRVGKIVDFGCDGGRACSLGERCITVRYEDGNDPIFENRDNLEKIAP